MEFTMLNTTTLRKVLFIIILTLLSTSQASTVVAGFNAWKSNGPEGADVLPWRLTGDAATLYAGTDGGGVFKSTNGGGNWMAVTPA